MNVRIGWHGVKGYSVLIFSTFLPRCSSKEEGIYEFMHFIDLPLTGFYWRNVEYFICMMFLFGIFFVCLKLI